MTSTNGVALTLAEIRRALVDARAALRVATEDLPVAKARAEQDAIDWAASAKGLTNGSKAKALGDNAEDRARALALALSENAAYLQCQSERLGQQREVESLEAELEILLDARRDAEWAIRARLAEALLARGVAEPVTVTDDEFTATATAATDNVVYEEGAWATNLPF